MNYYVYIITNRPEGTLYVGVTSNLVRRIFEHKNKFVDGFSKRYRLDRLVYYEIYSDILTAITREKQMKKWNRQWKINRIIEMNPTWTDLYDSIIQ